MAGSMTRHLDSLGRIVIPKETCRLLGLHGGVPLEFFLNEDTQEIILRRYGCSFCGALDEETVQYRGIYVCGTCRRELMQRVRVDTEAVSQL